MINKKQF